MPQDADHAAERCPEQLSPRTKTNSIRALFRQCARPHSTTPSRRLGRRGNRRHVGAVGILLPVRANEVRPTVRMRSDPLSRTSMTSVGDSRRSRFFPRGNRRLIIRRLASRGAFIDSRLMVLYSTSTTATRNRGDVHVDVVNGACAVYVVAV